MRRYFLFPGGGWSGEQKDGDAPKWKAANEIVTVATGFAIVTGRLEYRRKERAESEESNNEQSDLE